LIKFKDRIFEQYFIDPETAVITDKDGVEQPVKLYRSRPYFKGIGVHQIMAHTFFGWKPELVIHHRDENPLNNALANLMYLTRAEHCCIHMKGNKFNLGRIPSKETIEKRSKALKGHFVSEETKRKISVSHLGEKHPLFGKHLSAETRAKMSAAQKRKA